jgi:hypothetical protein
MIAPTGGTRGRRNVSATRPGRRPNLDLSALFSELAGTLVLQKIRDTLSKAPCCAARARVPALFSPAQRFSDRDRSVNL